MSVFDQLGNQPAKTQQNPVQMLSQLRQDPAGMLRQAGYSIPAGMTNPQQMVQHLVTSGQVGRDRLTLAQQMARGYSTR